WKGMKSLLTSHQTLGAIATAKTTAIRYGPGVRQARRANGSSSRIIPSVAANANAAYFDQNAAARNRPASTQSTIRWRMMARQKNKPVSAQNGSCIWSCANFTTEKL